MGVTVAGWRMAVGWGAVGRDTPVIGTYGRLIEPDTRLLGIRRSLSGREDCVDAPQRLVATEHFEGLEDARGDRRAGQRDADRLEDVARLDVALLDELAQHGLDSVDREGLDGRERVADGPERRPAVVAEPLVARLRVVGRAVEDEARQRPEFRERLHLLLGDRDRRAQVAVAAEVPLEALRELVGTERAHVPAVQPAQLLLVEARGVARDALDAEALHELVG